MARIRTIPKAVRAIKAKDPESYITVERVRRLVKSGAIQPVPCCGHHTLIDLDRLEDFLSGGAYADR